MSRLNLDALELAVGAVAQGLVEYQQYPMLLTIRDGVIQRFEIAMNLSWKLMQRALRDIYPEFDSYLYKLRHLVENLFARLKHFRALATRYEKLARNFKAMLYLACVFIWIKQ